MRFLVKRVVAERANVLQNEYAAGIVPPTAVLGLFASIGPSLGLERWGAEVVMIVHDVTPSKGRTKPAPLPSGGRFAPVEIPEDHVARVTMSFLVRWDGLDDEDDLADALLGRRLAGSPIVGDAVDVSTVPSDGTAFAFVPRGYVLAPTEERTPTASGDVDDLSAVADAVFPVVRPGPGEPRPVPVAIGYRLLEDPRTVPSRLNTRDADVPHVFAEPVVGVGTLRSVRSRHLSGLDAKGVDALAWRWDARGAHVVTHPIYHPNPMEGTTA